MLKRVFILSLALLLVVVTGKVYAQEGPVMPAQAQVVKYSIVPAPIPGDGSSMTNCELNELKKDDCRTAYNFGKRFVVPGEVIVPKDTEEAVDELAVRFATLQSYTENLGLRFDMDPSVSKIEILNNMDTGWKKIRNPIANSIEGPIENAVGNTTFARRIDGLDADIEVINGRISSVWMGNHGYEGIALKLKLSPLSQKWELFDGNKKMTGINFIVAGGNLDGMQSEGTVKIYAVALEHNVGIYTILSDANVDGGSVDPSGRPVLIAGIEYDVFLAPTPHMPRASVYKFLGNLHVPENCIDKLFRNDICVASRQ